MTAPTQPLARTPIVLAFALALAAAVSLGLARFSHALLLPPMRAELHWSYLTAGAMNTANAAGYLAGALLAPRWFARRDALRVATAGGLATAAILVAHAFAASDAPLSALRTLAGVALKRATASVAAVEASLPRPQMRGSPYWFTVIVAPAGAVVCTWCSTPLNV